MNADQPQHEDEISLIDLWIKAEEWWAYLWKRKGWILTITLLFAIGGYVKAKWAKPSYLATLTFSLEQGGGSSSSLSSLASQFGYSMGSDGGGMFSGENLLALMKSRRMVEDVLLTPVAVGGDSILLIDQYVQSWPELKNPATAIPAAAASKSASSNTTTGALPPNSKCTRFKEVAAACATSIPARTLPVTDTIDGVL